MNSRIIDLRSDTVTKPTAEMRRAMESAEVGDDVYGEDPTVNRLQERAAEVFNKEAALFVPTGTMGNQIAVKLHTRSGQEVIVEEQGHIFNFEMATMAAFSGVLARPVKSTNGILEWRQIEAAIHPDIYYYARTGLIALENTHNMAGGTVYTRAQSDEICHQANARKIPIHLDGARIFNASAALNTSVRDLCGPFDTVMFCLSKGLCAPVGSMLLGRRDAMEEGRRLRKMLGGGMRQAGVLAAAGLIALEEMPKRLHIDHQNAAYFAQGVASLPGISIDPAVVRTNIVIFDLSADKGPANDLLAKLKEEKVFLGAIGPQRIRAVTHADVSRQDIEHVLGVLKRLLSN
ncbi:MAG TPA: GntG family PLP-dependent aldolase [Acidobacteriota bacterium]